jgi:hypothetical protein
MNGKKCSSKKCNNLIDSKQPKNSRFCKACSDARKQLYDNDQAIEAWRKRIDWNAYMRRWRKNHYQQYREQNNRHKRACIERLKHLNPTPSSQDTSQGI